MEREVARKALRCFAVGSWKCAVIEMVLSKVKVQLHRLKQLHLESAKDHKRLIRVLDSIQLETMKTPTKIAVEITSFEQMATLASHLFERDQVMRDALDRSFHHFHAIRTDSLQRLRDRLRGLKCELQGVRDSLRHESASMQKATKRITLVVEEFRSRCRETYTEHLKGLDLDLRKILKPLVPGKVLDEQIKYRKINPSASVQSSLQSTIKSELREGHDVPDPQESGETDLDLQTDSCDQAARLNAHIELLVNTLESVAKDLISLCGDVSRRYYEMVDPMELISGPPTPLAAPLPEYFSFKAADYIEDQLELMNIVDPVVISESQRRILIEKLMKLNRDGHLTDRLLQPEKAEKLRRKLESLCKRHMDIRELNLEEILKDGTIVPTTEREKLVYSLIHSERPENQDVTLDEIINATQESDTESVKHIANPRESRKKAPRKRTEDTEDIAPPPVDQSVASRERGNKSEILEPPALMDVSYDGRTQHAPSDQPRHTDSFYTPQADAIRKPQSFFEQHRRSLPPITKLDKKGSRSSHGMRVGSSPKPREDRQGKDVRARSVTPVQGRRLERKSPLRRSAKSPGRRQKQPFAKKNSMS